MDDDDSIALISPLFHAAEPGFQDADLVLLTTDAVFFYAHTHVLLQDSCNRFNDMIPERDLESLGSSELCANSPMEPRVVISDYSSIILEIVLSAIYQTSADSLNPSAATVRDAITALQNLGYNIHNMISPGSTLFLCALHAAELEPLMVFTMAAEHLFEPLAVAASRLVSADLLHRVTDDLAGRMGPIYLRRLFSLHMKRERVFRHLVRLPLNLHTVGVPSGIKCNEQVQASVNQVWTLASGYAVVQGNFIGLDEVISSFEGQLSCELCSQSLKDRLGVTARDWSLIEDTI